MPSVDERLGSATAPVVPKDEEQGKKRKLHGVVGALAKSVAVFMAIYHIWNGVFGASDALQLRTIHLMFALVLTFLLYPGKSTDRRSSPCYVDWALLFLSLVSVGYILADYTNVVNRVVWVTPLEWYQYLFGLVGVALVIIATRRVMGPGLPTVALVAIAYGLWGNHIPGFLKHSGFSLVELTDQLFLSTEGIFGTPLAVSATYVILFVIFGAFLARSGAAGLFMDLASVLTGRTRGGPAKMAVMSSALFGTVSGSAIANVVTTGQFTIPMMMKTGFPPELAGAVEAVSSSGGQIMPPVMGAAAFIMAQYTGVPYGKIIIYAALPAILYYAAVFFQVDLEAARLGLKGISVQQTFWGTLKKEGYLLLPLVVLIVLLVLNYGACYAAILSTVAMVVVASVRPETRMGLSKILNALQEGAEGAVGIALSCATAGIVVGIVTLTGLGMKFTNLIASVGQNNLVLASFLTMLATLVLGMGLPTTPAYIIGASIMAPPLVKLGIGLIPAHLFVLYFAVISNITPPVALAAYAAAGLSGGNANKTGWRAFALGAAAYIVPFMFIYNPQLLLLNVRSFDVVEVCVSSLIGIYALAIAGVGFWVGKRMGLMLRVVALISSLLLIKPGLATDVMGVLLLVGLWLIQSHAKESIAGTGLSE